MPYALALFELRDCEVRNAARAHLSCIDQLAHLAPGILEWRSQFIGPMKLVEIDPRNTQPAQRGLAFSPDRFRTQVALRRIKSFGGIEIHAALGENVRTLAGRNLFNRAPHHLFGVPKAIHRRGIDPVDSQLDAVPHSGDGIVIVLRPPAERPSSSANRPGSHTYRGDFHAALAKRSLFQHDFFWRHDRFLHYKTRAAVACRVVLLEPG